MAKRERVDFTPQIEQLGVQADAGNAFIPAGPATPRRADAGQGALRLAQGLSGINQRLQGFVQQNIREANTLTAQRRATFKREELARGKSAAAKAAAEAGKAVRERILPPNASPYFIQGMKEQNARILGTSYHQQMMTSMQELNPVTGDINSHLKEQSDAFIAENPGLEDPTTFNEFQRAQASIDQNIRYAFLSGQAKAFRVKKGDLTYQEGLNMVSDMQLRASESNTPLNVQLMGSRLAQQAQSDRFLGQDPAVTRQKLADAVIQRALDTKNPRLLEALQHTGTTDPETGATIPAFSKHGKIAEDILGAREQIRRDSEHKEDRMRRIRSDDQTQAGYAVQSIFGERLSQDPAAAIPKGESDRYRKMYPQFDSTIRKMRGLFARIPAVPATLEDRARIESLIDSGDFTPGMLLQSISEGGVNTDEFGTVRSNAVDYGTLAKRIKAQNESAKKGMNVLRYPAVREAEKDVMTALAPPRNRRGAFAQGVSSAAIAKWKAVSPMLRQRWKSGFTQSIIGKETQYTSSPAKLQEAINEYSREFLKNHEFIVEKKLGERERVRRELDITVPLSGISGEPLKRIIRQYRANKTGPMATEIQRLWPGGPTEEDNAEYRQWYANIASRLREGRTK